MKTVYDAANALEAHLLQDLLRQEGIDAHVRGEALQGAVGEIPASGLVRLEVDEAAFDAARAVIQRWEATAPDPTPTPPVPPARRSTLRGWVLGLVIGAGLAYAACRVPVSTDGIDYNGDGTLDERWTYAASGLLRKVEIDRNLDGKVDYVAHYDARGHIESAELDDNFDGVFETRQWLKDGNVAMSVTDTDGDGYPEQRINYTHGVVETVETMDPASGKPLRVEHYRLGVLQFADLDTDADGRLDTRVTYTRLGEVAARTPLPR